MIHLITDRTAMNVARRNLLAAKAAVDMTEAEYAEWTGNPLLSDRFEHSEIVNLLGDGPFYGGVTVTSGDGTIRVTAPYDGVYLYTVAVVGAAEYFENKSLTLSVGSVSAEGGTPLILPYWHDGNGYEPISGALSGAGSVTFNTGENTGGRENLALYIYVTQDISVTSGVYVEYRDVMLEFGETKHDFVPYTPIIPTNVTKGAYNYTDLNRVERAVKMLGKALSLDLETKTDWTMYDIPTGEDMYRYLDNVRKLRKASAALGLQPSVPDSMRYLDYSMANDIERVLFNVENTFNGLMWCGDVFCGEV